jgi:hypothetical protein
MAATDRARRRRWSMQVKAAVPVKHDRKFTPALADFSNSAI